MESRGTGVKDRLPLLLLASALAFLALTAGVMLWSWIAVTDSAINASLGSGRAEPFLTLFLWLTALGSSPIAFAICAVTACLLWVARLPHLVLPLWVMFLGGLATSWSVKLLVGRVRPTFLDIATASSPSFPSGHSMSAMAVYGFLAFIVLRHGPERRTSVWMAISLAAVIALVGFSRMFLSLHYASDVLGGFLVGGFWLMVGIALARRSD